MFNVHKSLFPPDPDVSVDTSLLRSDNYTPFTKQIMFCAVKNKLKIVMRFDFKFCIKNQIKR